ncbi:hypothetical protein [Metabacillus indicus]|uniref:hypothetical protein n=1 Tax=Metabacillus indicus TaxID=246786 RepID=UPI002490E16B|nr:hypothetical protein [Metabacillus indicus]
MEDQLKLALGKILGEIYKTQQLITGDEVPDKVTFGLLAGIEDVIDGELMNIEMITKEDVKKVDDVLYEHFDAGEKEEAFSGYYDIEHRLSNLGVSRWKAIQIIKLFNAESRYTTLIEKMNSSNSPGECKDFRLKSYDW